MIQNLVSIFIKASLRRNATDYLATRAAMERTASIIPAFILPATFQKVTIGSMLCEWVIPQDSGDKVLLYLHGGGYVNGSHRTHRGLVTQLINHTGIKALVINYRMAPEHPFPAALDDALMAYQWLLAQGYTPDQIAIGGDSAGGGLSLALLYKLKELQKEMPKCAVLICPWTDLLNNSSSFISNEKNEPFLNKVSVDFWADIYASSYPKTHPLISPLYGNPEGLPTIYIQAAGKDVLLQDAVRFVEKAKNAGVDVSIEIYPDMFHVWQAFWPFLSDGRSANKKIGSFLKQQLTPDA